METCRFANLSSAEINCLAENASNANTSKSTKLWSNVFKAWAAVRGKVVDLQKYSDAEELDKTLGQFYSEIRIKWSNGLYWRP